HRSRKSYQLAAVARKKCDRDERAETPNRVNEMLQRDGRRLDPLGVYDDVDRGTGRPNFATTKRGGKRRQHGPSPTWFPTGQEHTQDWQDRSAEQCGHPQKVALGRGQRSKARNEAPAEEKEDRGLNHDRAPLFSPRRSAWPFDPAVRRKASSVHA